MLWDKKRFKLLTHFSPSLENFIMAKVVFLNHNSRLITEIMSDIMLQRIVKMSGLSES